MMFKKKNKGKKKVFGAPLDPNSDELPVVLVSVVDYFSRTGDFHWRTL